MFSIIESGAWIALSLVIWELFSIVHGSMNDEEINVAFVYTVSMGLLWMVSVIAKNNSEFKGITLFG